MHLVLKNKKLTVTNETAEGLTITITLTNQSVILAV